MTECNFIVIDTETGGLSPWKNPLLQIGAVDMVSGKTFYGECAFPQKNKQCTETALSVNGIDLRYWTHQRVPYLVETLKRFSKWLGECESEMVLAGHNPKFDLDFIRVNFWEYDLPLSFKHRTIDMHTLAYAQFGKSMTSDEIYEMIGMGKEPRPHNALTGAKMEAEAFKMLMER